MNKKHLDRWGDPLPELKQAIAQEYLQRITEDQFKPQFRGKGLHDVWMFTGLAEEILKAIPENVTLSMVGGKLNFQREDIKLNDYEALQADTLKEYTKDRGPASLDELLDRGLKASTFKEMLQ